MSKKKRTIALIDGDVLVYRIGFAVEKSVDWGEGKHTLHADEQEATQAVDLLMGEILEAVGSQEYFVALTCHETVNFRKYFYPAYKENRTKNRKPLLWKFIREYLTSQYAAQVKANLEADDILGIWSTKQWTGAPDRVIVSIDKDFKSVPGRFYNFNKQEWYEITEEEADFNFFMQVLTGDKTDNYPGCQGIGPKKAQSILSNATSQSEEGTRNNTLWRSVLTAYKRTGFGAEYALTQARCARILRACDYDFTKKQPILWSPPL
jgi:DNA polymerase-1